jgi:hypothetical protein
MSAETKAEKVMQPNVPMSSPDFRKCDVTRVWLVDYDEVKNGSLNICASGLQNCDYKKRPDKYVSTRQMKNDTKQSLFELIVRRVELPATVYLPTCNKTLSIVLIVNSLPQPV